VLGPPVRAIGDKMPSYSLPSYISPGDDAPSGPSWRIRIRRYLPYIITTIALTLLIIVSVLLWRESGERFVRLPAGTYSGEVHDVLGSMPAAFYLEVTPKRNEALVFIMKSGIPSQKVPLVGRGVDASESDWVLPVTVASEDPLKFTGGSLSGDRYEGTVSATTSGARGHWFLRPVKGAPTRDDELLAVRVWLTLNAELEEVERRIESAQSAIPHQKKELVQLSEFIAEGEQLKRNADRKFSEEKARLSHVDAALTRARDEVAKLKQRYELAQRLTPTGKLVALSREALEREARWIEAVLTSGGTVMPPEVEANIKRGERVIQLKREIELERRKIDELLAATEQMAEMPREGE
jgi:hypothetical protein